MTTNPTTEHDPQPASSPFNRRNLFPQLGIGLMSTSIFFPVFQVCSITRGFTERKLSNCGAFHLHSEVPVSNTVHDTDCSDMVLVFFFSPSRHIPGCYFELGHDLLHPFQFIIIQRNLVATSIGKRGGPTVPHTAKPSFVYVCVYLPTCLSISLSVSLSVCLTNQVTP